MTLNWPAIIASVLISAGCAMVFGFQAAGAVLMVFGVLHGWAAWRDSRPQ